MAVTLTDSASPANTVTNTVTAASGSYSAAFTTTQLASLSQGSVSISAVATDTSGAVSSAGTGTAMLDTTLPTAATAVVVTPKGGTVVANTLNGTNTDMTATATITAGQATKAELYVGSTKVATDSSIGANDTSVSFDVGTTTTAGLQAAVATGGTVTVKLYDAAGNVSTSTESNPTLTVDYSTFADQSRQICLDVTGQTVDPLL